MAKVLEIPGQFKKKPDAKGGHWTKNLPAQPKSAEEMNKTEALYADYLEILRRSGQIKWFAYNSVRFKIGKGAWLKPDFAVLTIGGAFELHEVKGFWAEASRVRIKAAALQFPFRFVAVKRVRGNWCFEQF